MGEHCKHCRSGFLDNRFGTDIECVNGVLIDIDVAHEGWARDVIYPPAPCIAEMWAGGEHEGWFGECQRRLSGWADIQTEPIPRVGAAIACAASSKGGERDALPRARAALAKEPQT